jgi:hypothetical protein
MTQPYQPWQKTDSILALVLFVVTLAIGCVYVTLRPFGTLDEEPRVGAHIARGHGFLTSLDPTAAAEPTAWVPPGYPLITAAVYTVLGVESNASLMTLLLLNAVMFGALVSGAYCAGRLIFGREVALITALLLIIHPIFLLRMNYFWHTYIAQAMLMWLVVMALWISRTKVTTLRLALFGCVFGLLVQINGSFVLAAPVLGWLAVRHEKFVKQLAMAVVSATCFLAMIAPWTYRNYSQFGELMYIRRGAELEMWIGNLRGSNGWQDLSIHPSVPMIAVDGQPVRNPENLKMIEMGEKAYFAYCGERFKAEYEYDPAAYWIRTVRRIGYLFVGPMSAPSINQVKLTGKADLARWAFDMAIFIPAVCGLVLAYKRGYQFLWFIPLSLLSTIPYIISHVNYRFTMHIRLFLLMAAVFFALALLTKLTKGKWPHATLSQ